MAGNSYEPNKIYELGGTVGTVDTTAYPSYGGTSSKKSKKRTRKTSPTRTKPSIGQNLIKTGAIGQRRDPLDTSLFGLLGVPGAGAIANSNPSRFGSRLANPLTSTGAESDGVDWYGKSASDFLAQALGMLPGSGDLYAKQEEAARKNNSEVSAKMQALYRYLNSQNESDLAGSGAIHDANRAAMQAATDQATQTISEGANADAAVMEQAIRNGQNMTGLEGLLANYKAADSTQSALGDVSSRGQEFMNIANTGATNADTGYRNNMATLRSQTLGYENANGRNLLQQLAEIDTARLQAEQERQLRAASLASQLYGDDYGKWSDETTYNRDMERDAWDRSVYEQDRQDQIDQYQNDLLMQMNQGQSAVTVPAQMQKQLWEQAVANNSTLGSTRQPDPAAVQAEYQRLIQEYLATMNWAYGVGTQGTQGTQLGRRVPRKY